MEEKKSPHLYNVIMLIVCFVIFIGVLSVYLGLKKHIKPAVEQSPEESTPQGAVLDIYNQIENTYRLSFTCELGGDKKSNYLPEWIDLVLGDVSKERLSITGEIYGCGMDFLILDESGGYVTVYVDNTGCYLKDYNGYSFVRVSDGVSGRTVLNAMLDTLTDMSGTEGLRLGVTEDNYSAFSFDSGYTCELFSLPVGFSAYEVPVNTGSKGFSLYGYGDGIELSVSVSENREYVLQTDTEGYVNFSEVYSNGIIP